MCEASVKVVIDVFQLLSTTLLSCCANLHWLSFGLYCAWTRSSRSCDVVAFWIYPLLRFVGAAFSLGHGGCSRGYHSASIFLFYFILFLEV